MTNGNSTAEDFTTPAEKSFFRKDINGLRALAVIAVLLYHFAVPGISGGFVGVDVFFVISGFLMAGIVCRGLDAGTFSLVDFYLARARRIWPVLLLVTLLVLVLGWFLLMPSEYRLLGKHARDSLLFSSNIRYFKEAGYFDVASQQKWLLHTWSLSVEWQFYLLYPLVLLGVRKLAPGRKALLAVHLLAMAGSFVACLVLTHRDSSAAFFLLQSRAWELLLGAVVYLAGPQLQVPEHWRRGVDSLGFALIVLAIAFIDTDLAWPGYLALVPTLGACLILLAAQQRSPWTGSQLAQWLGTRSYSIYLWHWPLVLLLGYYQLQHSPYWVAAGVLGSLLLGHLSYRAIEVPVGQRLYRWGKAWTAVCLLGGVTVLASAAQHVRETGVPQRLPAAVARIDAEASNRNPTMSKCLDIGAPCVYGGADIRALVIGDSHADALVTAVQASLPDPRQGVFFQGRAGCLTVEGAHKMAYKNKTDKCAGFEKKLFAHMDTLYPGVPLVLINRTTGYVAGPLFGERAGQPNIYFSKPSHDVTPEFLEEFRHHYVESVCKLTRQHPVYLLRPIPEMLVDVPLAQGRAAIRGLDVRPFITRAQYQQRNAFVWSIQDLAAQQCGAHILDPLPYLCDEQKCYGTHDGRPVYADESHMSEYGNRLLVPLFARLFATLPEPGAALAAP